MSYTSMASSARVIGRNIFKSHLLTQEKCFFGVVFKASVALSSRSVGDSSSILSVLSEKQVAPCDSVIDFTVLPSADRLWERHANILGRQKGRS